MIVVWIPLALTLSAFTVATLLAWLRGSAADRVFASGILFVALASVFTLDWDHWLHIQISTFVLDVVLLAVLTLTTIRWMAFDRIILTSLQLLMVAAHLARGLLFSERDGAYALCLCTLTYLQAAFLLAAMVVRARRRLKERST